MKRTVIGLFTIALCAALVGAASNSVAAVIFSDDFNKNDQPLVGTTPNVGGAWGLTGTNVTNPEAIVSGAVPLNTSGQDVYAAFTAPVPDADGFYLHTSADITVTAIPAGTAGDYFLHLSDPAGTTSFFYQRLLARASGAGFQLGMLATGGGGGIADFGSTVLNLNQKYHVDINWNFVAGALNDTFAISVDGSPYANHTWNSTSGEPVTISAVNLRQGSLTTGAPNVVVDNVAVEVVPEPGTLMLLVVGAAMAALRRNK